MADEVGEERERLPETLARDGDPHHGGVPARRGLELDAEALEVPGEALRGTGPRAGLEGVRREVRQPGLPRGIAGRARVDDQLRRHDRQIAVAGREHGQVVAETSALDAREIQRADGGRLGRSATVDRAHAAPPRPRGT